jgi:integrase/recombinase XerD
MSMRLKSLMSQFLDWCEVNRRPKTTESYRHQLDKWSQCVKNKTIDRFVPADLSRHSKSWHRTQAVQRMFQWAVDEIEALPRNPFAKVTRPPAGQRIRIMTPTQLSRLFRRARKPFREFLIGMRETLARPQEIRQLQWEWLMPDPGWIGTLDEALAAGRAMFVLWSYKARDRREDPSEPRKILINRRFGRLLIRKKRKLPELRGPVFTNRCRRPLTANAIRCSMRVLRKICGIKPEQGENIVAYTIRHSISTLASGPGKVRDRMLADLLGHTNPKTTRRYQHLQVDHLRIGMDAIEQLRINARLARVEAKNRCKAA